MRGDGGDDRSVLEIERLTYAYGERTALDGLTLSVGAGEVFGFLGPNGSGKTTLFRILSTLVLPTGGVVRYAFAPGPAVELGRGSLGGIRRHLGVVFQNPSVDKELTALENLRHQGHLYGLRGRELEGRAREVLGRLRLGDRADERVKTFSGGMRRRVELAKGLLHRPRLLLLDEPSTGLDPVARHDLWEALGEMNRADGVTVLVTTHLLEEAERCGRVAILDQGKLVACDAPAALKDEVGGDVVTLTTREPGRLAEAVRERFGVEVRAVGETLRVERRRAHEFVPQLVEAFPGMIESVTVGRPTLEDVFVKRTGRRLTG